MILFTEKELKEINEKILLYYEENGRSLPWRDQGDFYSVWLSEIMSQQTRMEVVVDYYLRFKEALPRIEDLAQVEEDRLLKLWEGLGYYNRARNLKKAAQVLVNSPGPLPSTYEDLMALPGIGPYTAAAILSMVYHKPYVALDGNLIRVFTRLLAYEGDVGTAQSKRDLENFGLSIIGQDPSSFNQGLMDLASAICRPKGQALCGDCPLKDFCQAYKKDQVEDFPVKAKKKPRKVVHRSLFLLTKRERLAFRKRPKKGLLAGQWEIPGLDQALTLEDAKRILLERDIFYEEIQEGPSYKHIFSHVEWRIQSYLVDLKDLPLVRDSAGEERYFSSREIQEEVAVPSAFSPLVDFWMEREEKNEGRL